MYDNYALSTGAKMAIVMSMIGSSSESKKESTQDVTAVTHGVPVENGHAIVLLIAIVLVLLIIAVQRMTDA